MGNRKTLTSKKKQRARQKFKRKQRIHSRFCNTRTPDIKKVDETPGDKPDTDYDSDRTFGSPPLSPPSSPISSPPSSHVLSNSYSTLSTSSPCSKSYPIDNTPTCSSTAGHSFPNREKFERALKKTRLYASRLQEELEELKKEQKIVIKEANRKIESIQYTWRDLIYKEGWRGGKILKKSMQKSTL